jgi:hypothetical protein
MLKKRFIGIILLVIIGCSLIIFVPIQIILIRLSSYSTINKSCRFIHQPSSPSSIEELNINSDVGNVEIRYIDPLVDYYVLIDVNIVLSGQNVAGRLYEDYLNITWNNSSSPINFNLEIISDDWFNPSLWLIKDVSIIVNLRKDIVFDIETNMIEGNYEITIPGAVSIGNILTNVSNGNILYDFEYGSTMQGNITGITNNGDLELKSYNMEITQNCNWLLNITGGNLNIEIYQYKEMGANITCTAIISTGVIDLFYHDNNPNIGAIFYFPLSWWYIPTTQPGFESTPLDNGFFYKSNDFPTNSNYNISFYHLGGQGPPNHFIEIYSDENLGNY